LVSAAAAGQARHLRLKTTLLARGAYPQRRSRCPLQTVLARLLWLKDAHHKLVESLLPESLVRDVIGARVFCVHAFRGFY